LITGASGGIGFICAKALAARGATLILSCPSLATFEAIKRGYLEKTVMNWK